MHTWRCEITDWDLHMSGTHNASELCHRVLQVLHVELVVVHGDLPVRHTWF